MHSLQRQLNSHLVFTNATYQGSEKDGGKLSKLLTCTVHNYSVLYISQVKFLFNLFM